MTAATDLFGARQPGLCGCPRQVRDGGCPCTDARCERGFLDNGESTRFCPACDPERAAAQSAGRSSAEVGERLRARGRRRGKAAGAAADEPREERESWWAR